MMVLEIRKIKITVYIATNKYTIEKEFEDIEEAKKFLEESLED